MEINLSEKNTYAYDEILNNQNDTKKIQMAQLINEDETSFQNNNTEVILENNEQQGGEITIQEDTKNQDDTNFENLCADPEDSFQKPLDLSHIDFELIDISEDYCYRTHKYNSLSYMDVIRSMKISDGSDKRHYGYCLPLYYCKGRPVIVLGRDWPFSAVMWLLMIYYYFSGFNIMYFSPYFPVISNIVFQILRIIHFIACFQTTFINSGFYNFNSYEDFSKNFKIGAKNMEELEAIALKKNWKKCQPCRNFSKQDVTHCTRCDVCYEGWDHHCPWMAKCVAKDSLVYFYFYIGITFFSLFYGMAINMMNLADAEN